MLRKTRRSKDITSSRTLYRNLIACMERRLEDQPADLRLRLSLVTHLQMAGRYEEAIQQVKQVLQLHPGNRRAKAMLLRLWFEQRVATFQHLPG